jgi:hypothetical protein
MARRIVKRCSVPKPKIGRLLPIMIEKREISEDAPDARTARRVTLRLESDGGASGVDVSYHPLKDTLRFDAWHNFSEPGARLEISPRDFIERMCIPPASLLEPKPRRGRKPRQ